MHCDPTIDELLGEPIIRTLMARDGVRAEEIRVLMDRAQARAETTSRSGAAIPPRVANAVIVPVGQT